MDQRAAKARLRAEMKALRAALSPDEIQALSERAAGIVLGLPEWRQARIVCLYASFRQELGTMALLRAALATGKTLTLPRARPDGTLSLHEVRDLAELTASNLGIPEPRADARLVEPSDVDFFLVPGLAFDPQAHRLGYGAGFYDRLLAEAKPAAFLLGYGYAFQTCAEVPCEDHDRTLMAVATPDGIVRRKFV